MPKESAIPASPFGRVRHHSLGWLRARFPLKGELAAYSWEKLRADLVAGATVTLVSIPQAVGFALIAGLPPLMVIVSMVIGGFVAALFTSSHHLVFGPTNSISIILAATIFSFHATTLTPPQIAMLLAFLIGFFQLAAGLSRLGKVTQFISRSVIIGYGTAIGLLLAAGQVVNFFGMEAGERGTFVSSLVGSLYHLSRLEFNPYAAIMGGVALLIFHALEKFAPKLPAELVGLIFLSLLMRYGELHVLGIRTLMDEGELMASLPSFIGLPVGGENTRMITPLLGAALAVSILGMLEAVSIAKTLAAKSGQRLDVNQELVSMGLANLANSSFGAMPGSASFARSGTNLHSGACTQMAALLSSLLVLVALFFVSPLINYIPLPCLAAHLIRIGLKMVHRDQLRIAFRSTRSDAIVLVVTMASAFLLKLDIAIYVGVGISLALFLQKASAPSLVEYGFNEHGQLAEKEADGARRNPAISIVHVEGELFFGAADLFQEQVRYLADDNDIRVIILRMKNARHLDVTSVLSLLQLKEYLTGSGRHLVISGINPDVEKVLRASGAWDRIGAENIFPAEANLTMSTKRALLRASQLLQQSGVETKADIRIYYDRHKESAASHDAAPDASAGPVKPADFQI